MVDGSLISLGQWLVVHYLDGHIVEEKNSSNGMRPIIKLNYNIKLEKTADAAGNILWKILE